jgi:hypothetical protein
MLSKNMPGGIVLELRNMLELPMPDDGSRGYMYRPFSIALAAVGLRELPVIDIIFNNSCQ